MHRAPQSTRTYFLTFITAGRRRLFQVHQRAELMRAVLLHYRSQNKFLLHAYVIMPDHLHVLLTPTENVSLERAIQFIRGGFSFRLKIKSDVWERGHFGSRLSDGDGYDNFVQYIVDNPVRKRMTESAEDFPFSSANRPNDVDPRPAWLR